jgi:hypothetical protein
MQGAGSLTTAASNQLPQSHSRRPPSQKSVPCSSDCSPSPQHILNRRRCLLIGPSLASVLAVGPSLAEEGQGTLLADALGAPLEFLKSRQRANGGEKLLAPIRSARRRLKVSPSSALPPNSPFRTAKPLAPSQSYTRSLAVSYNRI